MQKVKTAVLVSGGGTNLQAILDAERSGKITNATIAAVISDRAEAYALRRAEQAGVEAVTIPFKELGRSEFERQLILALQ